MGGELDVEEVERVVTFGALSSTMLVPLIRSPTGTRKPFVITA